MTAQAPPQVRPMTPADYEQGQPVAAGTDAHATRDLIVGAVVGAAALWAVPKMLDALADQFAGRLWTADDAGDEMDLEP